MRPIRHRCRPPCAGENVTRILGERLDALPLQVGERKAFPLGVYDGLRFGIVLNPQFAPEIYLEGALRRHDTLSRDHRGPRAVLNALERLSGSYASECNTVQKDLSLAQSQLRDYEARLGARLLARSLSS